MGNVSLECVSTLFVGIITLMMIMGVQQVRGLRFVIDRQECMSHKVDYEGDNVHISFVVVKSDAPWDSATNLGVDLVVIPCLPFPSFLPFILCCFCLFCFSYRVVNCLFPSITMNRVGLS